MACSVVGLCSVLWGGEPEGSDGVCSFTPPLNVTVVGSTLNPSENW